MTFKTAVPKSEPLDPFKRPLYSLGMVLGKDDLDQEQTFFLERDRLHNRLLHGYGTVCGLEVTRGEGTEIRVSPGIAINPRGEVIRVTPEQCADLQVWLIAERLDPLTAPPKKVHVVACYRECETDEVPIPGVPCRTEEETAVASRIVSSFALELRTEAPEQKEDKAVEDLVGLLRRIVVVEQGDGWTPQQLAGLVREVIGSEEVNVGDGDLNVRSDDLDAVLDAAYLSWITAIRPGQDGKNCSAGPPDEACVLLATLEFDATGDNWIIQPPDAEIKINQEARPYLLPTRLIQELRNRPLQGTPASPAQLDHHLLKNFDADDHKWYLRLNKKRGSNGGDELARDLSAGGKKITGLEQATKLKDAVPLNQKLKLDLGGTLKAPKVEGLLGYKIDNSNEANGRYLRLEIPESGVHSWVLDTPAAGGGGGADTRPILPFVTITPMTANLYRVWFNLDVSQNSYAVERKSLLEADGVSSANIFNNIRVHSEGDEFDLSISLKIGRAEFKHRNEFEIEIEDIRATRRLRFIFNLTILLDGTTPLYTNLLSLTDEFNFAGYDPHNESATAFVYNHHIPD